MKFLKTKTDALDGQVEVKYTQQVEGKDAPFPPFRIVARRDGVHFEGTSAKITDMKDLQEFAKIVSDAWKDHTSLQVKIATTLSGH